MTRADTAAAPPVEQPDHVHPTRMRHIGRDDLLAGIGHAGEDIAAVRRAVAERAQRRRPVWDPAERARELAGTARADEVVAAADALSDRDVDFVSPAAGRSGLYGLHYLLWLEPLLMAYELTGDERYPACFGRIFDNWYASRDDVVGDWPGLDVVWYSLGVWARASVLVPALTTFARSSALTDETAAAVLATLLGGARWAAEEHEAFRPGNWQLVCAGELLHVAAFLPAAPEAARWVEVGHHRLVEHLDRDFYADGGHIERSPGYHTLCLEALQRAALVAARDHGIRLQDHPTFARAHHWLAAMTTPGGWVPPWQDSTTVRPRLLLDRARRLFDVELELSAGSTHLDSSGYVVLRGPAPSDGFLALNAGPYIEHELESHSHLAVTDLVLSAWGVPLAVDPGGPPTYDDPVYQSWYRSPGAHTMLTVDGAAITPDRRAAVDHVDLGGTVQVVRAHHDGYPARVTRQVVFVGSDPIYWLVRDTVDGGLPATWSILGPVPWLAHPHGFRGEGAPSLLVLPADEATTCSHDVGPGQLPGGDVTSYGDLHALRLHAPAGRIDVLLAPVRDPGEAAWRIERLGGGWRITAGTVVDVLTDERWERRSLDGRLLGRAELAPAASVPGGAR